MHALRMTIRPPMASCSNDERQTVIGLTAGIENLAIGLDEYHIKLQNVYYNKKQSMDGKKKLIYLNC